MCRPVSSSVSEARSECVIVDADLHREARPMRFLYGGADIFGAKNPLIAGVTSDSMVDTSGIPGDDDYRYPHSQGCYGTRFQDLSADLLHEGEPPYRL